ncbi:hypothetical protein SP41_107 [Salmonella phage 41]|nr:hypothetical protein SP41_107 [Salmonella phage 41]
MTLWRTISDERYVKFYADAVAYPVWYAFGDTAAFDLIGHLQSDNDLWTSVENGDQYKAYKKFTNSGD